MLTLGKLLLLYATTHRKGMRLIFLDQVVLVKFRIFLRNSYSGDAKYTNGDVGNQSGKSFLFFLTAYFIVCATFFSCCALLTPETDHLEMGLLWPEKHLTFS